MNPYKSWPLDHRGSLLIVVMTGQQIIHIPSIPVGEKIWEGFDFGHPPLVSNSAVLPSLRYPNHGTWFSTYTALRALLHTWTSHHTFYLYLIPVQESWVELVLLLASNQFKKWYSLWSRKASCLDQQSIISRSIRKVYASGAVILTLAQLSLWGKMVSWSCFEGG